MKAQAETHRTGLNTYTTRYWITHNNRKAGPYRNIHEAGAAIKRAQAAIERRKV